MAFTPVAEHVHQMKLVQGILIRAMQHPSRNKIMVGDLNTDFCKVSLNREVFQDLLMENRGQKLQNQMWTYRKGSKESNIDHVLIFANKGELDNIGHAVLQE